MKTFVWVIQYNIKQKPVFIKELDQKRGFCVQISVKTKDMENIVLEATNNTPAIRFDINGRLLIEGKSLPINVEAFYDPLIKWAKELKAKITKIDINLEYANSSSSKKLLEFLKALDNNKSIEEFLVNWHYESDDEDALEHGQLYEEILKKAKFQFHQYMEAA